MFERTSKEYILHGSIHIKNKNRQKLETNPWFQRSGQWLHLKRSVGGS